MIKECQYRLALFPDENALEFKGKLIPAESQK